MRLGPAKLMRPGHQWHSEMTTYHIYLNLSFNRKLILDTCLKNGKYNLYLRYLLSYSFWSDSCASWGSYLYSCTWLIWGFCSFVTTCGQLPCQFSSFEGRALLSFLEVTMAAVMEWSSIFLKLTNVIEHPDWVLVSTLRFRVIFFLS